MPKKKKYSSRAWLLLGLTGALIAAPNATVMRMGVESQDPLIFNALRFGVVAIVCAPFLLSNLRKFTPKNRKFALLSALCIAMSVTASILAIKLSAASYVSIISLIAPIVMLILSARMVGDKITPRALAGISLAAMGAMVTILLPIAIHQGSHFVFYPWATVLALVNVVTFPLSTIYFKKANEKGMPFMPLMGLAALLVVITNVAIAGIVDGGFAFNLPHQNWWAVLYSGVAVAFVARTLNNLCYEHIGAAAVGALNYIGAFFAILIPVFVLGETLSMTMIIGGILMFLGVYVIQHHKSKHHRIYHAHINH